MRRKKAVGSQKGKARVQQGILRGLVFDKDGTLFDFHATWSVWCDGLIRGLCGPDPAQIEGWRGASTSTSTPAASPPRAR